MHHLTALRKILGMVISSPDRITFTVGELTFDDVGPESIFIQDRAGRASEPVSRGAGTVA